MNNHSGFCWVELATTDKERAARFYSRLLAWEHRPQELRTRAGLSLDYALLRLGDHVVGGMYQMIRAQHAQGMQPHWLPCAMVADAGAAGQRAESLNAKVLTPPLDVQDLGRLSILRDPQGAMFGLWQPKRLGAGFETRVQPGFPCWFELDSPAPAEAAEFYAALLAWTARPFDFGAGAYFLLHHGATPVAGVTRRTASPASRWLTFFRVADCAASCERAGSLHGTIVSSPLEVPGAGCHALVSDPQGVVFGLLTPPSA